MSSRLYAWAGLFLILAAGYANAECPSEPSAEPGIVLTRNQPFHSSLFKQRGIGITEQRVRIKSGPPESIVTYYPHPLAVGKRESATGVLSMRYAQKVDTIADLETTKYWKSEVTLFSGSREVGAGVVEIRFKGRGREEIGGCEYDTWVVENHTKWEHRGPIRFEHHYSPALNLVVRAVRLHPDGKPKSEVRFDRIEIARPL